MKALSAGFPGGVRPMTIACLLRNTLVVTRHQNGIVYPEMGLSIPLKKIALAV